MSNYVMSNNKVTIHPEGCVDVHKSIPAGVYAISFKNSVPDGLVYKHGKFPVPDKCYGGVEEAVERIRTTVLDRKRNTGILLQGPQGAGKSLTAKKLSNTLQDEGMATIVVPYSQIDQDVVDFIADIDCTCMVLFDELDKVHKDNALLLLSLLDGVAVHKKVFVVTANEVSKLGGNCHNRPGRFYYNLKFSEVSDEDAEQFCRDRLDNQEHVAQMVRLSSMVFFRSYDILSSWCEECNRYKMSPYEAVDMLNIEPDTNGTYKLRAFKDGAEYKITDGDDVLCFDPVSGTNVVYTYVVIGDCEDDQKRLSIPVNRFTKLTLDTVEYNVDGFTITCTKQPSPEYSPWDEVRRMLK